jgi:hypothetical protein
MSDIHIFKDYIRVTGQHFISDIDTKEALTCLGTQTFKFEPDQLNNMRALVEAAEQYWKEAGILPEEH